jgi:hypothetical protein
MADFAVWGEAVIRGLGYEPGSFLQRYNENRRAACEVALEECPVAEVMRHFALAECVHAPCEATASGLLRTLVHYASPAVVRSARWPKTPYSLGCRLRRIPPQLRTTGIALTFRISNNIRLITISLCA